MEHEVSDEPIDTVGGSAGLVVVSNRLPVRLEEDDAGPRWRRRTTTGPMISVKARAIESNMPPSLRPKSCLKQ